MIDTMMKLSPQEGSNAAPVKADEVSSTGRAVLVEGRLLVGRTAFVGHSFLEPDLFVVDFVKAILAEMQVTCITGEPAEASTVHEKVKRRILSADLFVGVFTRRDKIEGKDEWRTSDWVVEEMSFAAAKGKKIIVLREEGVTNIGGLQGNLEYIPFSRHDLHKTAVKLLQTLWSLSPGKFVFNSNRSLQMSLDVLKTAVDANPNEPMIRVALAGQLRQNGQLASALEQTDSVLAEFPNFAPALFEKATCLKDFGKKSEARHLLERLIEANPFDANIQHQFGHILSELGENDAAEEAFAIASDCDPGTARHPKCHADHLFRSAKRNTMKLVKAKELYLLAQELGPGVKTEKLIASAIKAVARRLKSLQYHPKRPSAGRRGPKNIR